MATLLGIYSSLSGLLPQVRWATICDSSKVVLKRASCAAYELHLKRELELHSQLHHVNIIALEETSIIDGCIVLEYAEHGTLLDAHRPTNSEELSVWLLDVAIAILHGICHIHNRGFVHRDIKPANILVKDVFGVAHMKIADFGISCVCGNPAEIDYSSCPMAGQLTADGGVQPNPLHATLDPSGTPHYAAPETSDGSPRVDTGEFSVASDFWAWACCVAQVATGDLPKHCTDTANHEFPFAEDKLRSTHLPPPLIDLLLQCFAAHREARPTAETLREELRHLQMQWNGAYVSKNPGNSERWYKLAAAMRGGDKVTINNTTMYEVDCHREVLKNNPSHFLSWYGVGIALSEGLGTFLFNGEELTTSQCFVNSLHANPESADSWFVLAKEVGANETVRVNGVSYTHLECYQETIRLNPHDIRPWVNAANRLVDGGVLKQGEKTFNCVECLVKALDIDPKYGVAWNNLAYHMKAGERVVVGLETLSRLDCCTKALNLNPSAHWVWDTIGGIQDDEQVLNLGGTVFTQKDCFIRSIVLNPNQSTAWGHLSSCLDDDESISIQGTIYTKSQCVSQSAQFS